MNHFWLAFAPFLVAAGCAKNEVPLPMPHNAKLIDVRSQEEYASGHISGAVLLPHGEIAAKIDGVAPDKSTPIYLYCRSGRRAGIAKDALHQQGYDKVYNLGGVDDAKKALKLPIEK